MEFINVFSKNNYPIYFTLDKQCVIRFFEEIKKNIKYPGKYNFSMFLFL